jgi:phospholipid transport system substrate-binding protein
MEKTATGWKIYDLNVLGVAGETTHQFAQEISAKGVDGLDQSLSQRNKSNAGQEILTTAPAALRLPHSVTHDTASA